MVTFFSFSVTSWSFLICEILIDQLTKLLMSPSFIYEDLPLKGIPTSYHIFFWDPSYNHKQAARKLVVCARTLLFDNHTLHFLIETDCLLPHGIFAAGGAFVPTQEKKKNWLSSWAYLIELTTMKPLDTKWK